MAADQYVIVTRYQPPKGYAIVNVYGPWPDKATAEREKRAMQRESADDPRSTAVEYRVRLILSDR